MVMPPPDKVECPDCKGSGRKYNVYLKTFVMCSRCSGEGDVLFLDKKY